MKIGGAEAGGGCVSHISWAFLHTGIYFHFAILLLGCCLLPDAEVSKCWTVWIMPDIYEKCLDALCADTMPYGWALPWEPMQLN